MRKKNLGVGVEAGRQRIQKYGLSSSTICDLGAHLHKIAFAAQRWIVADVDENRWRDIEANRTVFESAASPMTMCDITVPTDGRTVSVTSVADDPRQGAVTGHSSLPESKRFPRMSKSG